MLILAALLAAMTTILILFGHIRVGHGIVHMGDAMIYFAACLLPRKYALASAGLGGALANALGGHFVFIIPTLIIKMLITLPYCSESEKILTKRNMLMTIPAGLITIFGYFIAVWILFGWAGALTSLLGDLIQAGGSAMLFFIIAATLDRIKIKALLKNKYFQY